MRIQEQGTVHVRGFDGVQRGKYFGGKKSTRIELKVRVGKVRNGKAACKDDITGEMIKDGDVMVVDWVWKLCSMAFENDDNWMNFSLYKCEG